MITGGRVEGIMRGDEEGVVEVEKRGWMRGRGRGEGEEERRWMRRRIGDEEKRIRRRTRRRGDG